MGQADRHSSDVTVPLEFNTTGPWTVAKQSSFSDYQLSFPGYERRGFFHVSSIFCS